MAVILLYINAVMSLLFGAIGSVMGLLLVAGGVAAGLGIANERRWGYLLGVAVAGLNLGFFVVLPVVLEGIGVVLNPVFLVNSVFPVALFALLVHPMSRQYQRTWFR